VYQIEKTAEEATSDILENVSVVCPEDPAAQVGLFLAVDPLTQPHFDRQRRPEKPILSAIELKLPISRRLGCQNVTQFVGVIPTGRAPISYLKKKDLHPSGKVESG
jgi:hypothetical protein